IARHLVEWTVAVGAPREQRRTAERHGGGHLPELLAEVIALDEQMTRQMGIPQEPRVAGQQETALTARALDQRAVAQVAPVGDVVAEDAKPAGEPAEHPVDGETLHLAGLPPELGRQRA